MFVVKDEGANHNTAHPLPQVKVKAVGKQKLPLLLCVEYYLNQHRKAQRPKWLIYVGEQQIRPKFYIKNGACCNKSLFDLPPAARVWLVFSSVFMNHFNQTFSEML